MITPGVCIRAKEAFLTGTHQRGDEYYIALFGSKAALGPHVDTYGSVAGEAAGPGYTPGGQKLLGYHSGTTPEGHGFIGWKVNPEWSETTLKDVGGALIYNRTKGHRAVAVLALDEPMSSTLGPFELQFDKADGVIIIFK